MEHIRAGFPSPFILLNFTFFALWFAERQGFDTRCFDIRNDCARILVDPVPKPSVKPFFSGSAYIRVLSLADSALHLASSPLFLAT